MKLVCFVRAMLLLPLVTASHLLPERREFDPVQGLENNFKYHQTCIIPARNNGSDDTPAILDAFEKCKKNSHIRFQNTTYNIHKVMRLTELENVKIEINGTLLVC